MYVSTLKSNYKYVVIKYNNILLRKNYFKILKQLNNQLYLGVVG